MNDEQIAHLKNLCLGMTGHTEDPFEAIEQWGNERQALIETFDEYQQVIVPGRGERSKFPLG